MHELLPKYSLSLGKDIFSWLLIKSLIAPYQVLSLIDRKVSTKLNLSPLSQKDPSSQSIITVPRVTSTKTTGTIIRPHQLQSLQSRQNSSSRMTIILQSLAVQIAWDAQGILEGERNCTTPGVRGRQTMKVCTLRPKALGT